MIQAGLLPAWETLSRAARGDILRRFADLCVIYADEIGGCIADWSAGWPYPFIVAETFPSPPYQQIGGSRKPSNFRNKGLPRKITAALVPEKGAPFRHGRVDVGRTARAEMCGCILECGICNTDGSTHDQLTEPGCPLFWVGKARAWIMRFGQM